MRINCLDHNIYFGEEVYRELHVFFEENQVNISNTFILVDQHTHEACLPVFLANASVGERMEIIEIEAGETHKNIATCNRLWKTLSDLGADRNSLIINLGGGVITDIGGFVAATFMRGIRYLNVPTTLLSMVDASLGGKTGVDLGKIKNQIGVFARPEMVLIDVQFLTSLHERELKSGWAEMLKHGLIADDTHWQVLLYAYSHIDFDQLSTMIYDSVSIKNQIVMSDPKEIGPRKKLNFGHTFGHAIESQLLGTPQQLLHGEAIAIGMIMEAYLSHRQQGLSLTELITIKQHLLTVFSKVDLTNIPFNKVYRWMKYDKKNKVGIPHFSLLSSIGQCDYDCVVDKALLKEAWLYYQA